MDGAFMRGFKATLSVLTIIPWARSSGRRNFAVAFIISLRASEFSYLTAVPWERESAKLGNNIFNEYIARDTHTETVLCGREECVFSRVRIPPLSLSLSRFLWKTRYSLLCARHIITANLIKPACMKFATGLRRSQICPNVFTAQILNPHPRAHVEIRWFALVCTRGRKVKFVVTLRARRLPFELLALSLSSLSRVYAKNN